MRFRETSPLLLIMMVFCLLALASSACRQENNPALEENVQRDERVVSPGAPPLVIGLIPEQNIFEQTERYEPLARYLAGRIGRPIQLKMLVRYGNIINNFTSMGIDGAFFGSFTYVLAQKKLGLTVLARPEGLDGSSTYRGYILARKDSRIRTSEDLRGKVFVFVDKATFAGFLVPMYFFQQQGIGDLRPYFKEAYFAGTHGDVIYDLLSKKADLGAAKNTVFDRLASRDPRIRDQLVILYESPDVPENALAVRADLDASLIKSLKDVLLKMEDDPEGKVVLENFGARRFIETRDQDYQPVFDYADKIHLDLSTYEYMNE